MSSVGRGTRTGSVMALRRPAVGLGVAVLVVGALFAPPSGANVPAAATVQCGQKITRNTTLVADVGPCPGDGIIVGADNIILNLNGFTISGTPGPGDGNAAGIRLPNRTGVTVTGLPGTSGKKGTITGFDGGVLINRGSDNTIENLSVRDNLGPASTSAVLSDGIILFNSARNQIRNNEVIHNGYYDGIGILGPGSDGNLLEGNRVEGNLGVPHDRTLVGQGIILNNFLDEGDPRRGESLYDNAVVRNVVSRNFGVGISNISNVNGRIVGNVVEENGLFYTDDYDAANQGFGTGIGLTKGGNAVADTYVLVEGNRVARNGVFGILGDRGSSSNTIQNNESVSNGVGIGVNEFYNNQILYNRTHSNRLIDLYDNNENCDNNTWYGNTWGPPNPEYAEFFPVAYYPECTGTGGSESSPAAAGSSDPADSSSSKRAAEPTFSPPEADEAAAVPSRRPPSR